MVQSVDPYEITKKQQVIALFAHKMLRLLFL